MGASKFKAEDKSKTIAKKRNYAYVVTATDSSGSAAVA
jgi:hypothetical protein